MKNIFITLGLLISLISSSQQYPYNNLSSIKDYYNNSGVFMTVGGVSTIYASNYGFNVDSSGSSNYAAWQSIPSGYTVIIDAGTYNMDSTLFLKSNTTYTFLDTTIIQKETGSTYSFVMANENAPTFGNDSNIVVNGWVRLDINEIDNQDTDLKMRGIFQAYGLKNSTINKLKIWHPGTEQEIQYSTSFNKCENVTVNYLDVYAEKDGVNMKASHDMKFNNCKLYTRDDAFTMFTCGYTATTPWIDNVYNIEVNDIEIGTPSEHTADGTAIRAFSSAARQWVSGTSYTQYDLVYNAGGLYQRENSGTNNGTVAPTHTSGSVTGADGITWYYNRATTDTSFYVHDIAIDGVTLTSDRLFSSLEQEFTNHSYDTIANIDNFVINDITLPTDYENYLLNWGGYLGYVKYDSISGSFATGQGVITVTNPYRWIDSLVFGQCDLTLNQLDFASINTAGSNINEFTFDKSSINFVNTNVNRFFYRASQTNDFNTVNWKDAYFKYVGGEPFWLSPTYYKKINALNTVFDSIRLFSTSVAANAECDITLTDCEWRNFVRAIVVTGTSGCDVNYVSTGTTYIDPEFYMFNNTSGESGAINIDITESIGGTRSNVRNNANVTITNCDICP